MPSATCGALAGSSAEGLVDGFVTNNTKLKVDYSGNGFFAGKLTEGSAAFKIDHPLNPVNKYLLMSELWATVLSIPNPIRRNRNYFASAWSAWRVASRVLISDSLGSCWMIGSIIHPSPNGTSRVSEIARHSTHTPPSRSWNLH